VRASRQSIDPLTSAPNVGGRARRSQNAPLSFGPFDDPMTRTESNPSPVISALTRPLAVVLAGSCTLAPLVVVGLLEAGPGIASGARPFFAASLGAGSILLAGLAGLGVMWAIAHRDIKQLAMALLANSSVRLLGGVALGLTLFLALAPDKQIFWYTLLAAGIVSLALETVVTLRLLPAATPSASTTQAAHEPTGISR